MPALTHHNVERAAETSRGALGFVFSTTSPSRRKDDDNAYIRLLAARRKPL